MAVAVSIFKNKSVIIAFILGVLFAIFVAHAYVVYQTRALALQNRADIAQIATFLQQATGATPVAEQATTKKVVDDSEAE
ncbi:MAG: hypothetical protein A2571_00380 [Candidatus Vogelbacteria bacterium RIFOXYD1_FULL_44_32]|uniref:Uncharacterized protein n=1 Tax=Candidatus Vogelbacteria bacterium RIFOXYD1_FULL_44_32 TaxID=1802438 RepID=A0A1G2QEH7_9BACT|nr:MAG: hypothetical protein A2571_00380 [Candidatus Vogelbacteria bacterium RIFOXYD1_FULL_44_32]